MQKHDQKTVEFSNLSEDHKAEFIQFLIKNNICFQEGKENCTAKISFKNKNNLEANFVQKNINRLQPRKKNETKVVKNTINKKDRVLKEISVPNSHRSKEKQYEEK